MQDFYGTKHIKAVSMTRAEYNTLRGWILPADENPDDQGYLVEYQDSGQPNVSGFTGYVSWSPRNVFEASYQPFDALNFGHALLALKNGKKVARSGWNGKGMWLSLSCADSRSVEAGLFWSKNNQQYAEQQGGYAVVLPSITMKTATGDEILMGWLASSDMLADDWQIVE